MKRCTFDWNPIAKLNHLWNDPLFSIYWLSRSTYNWFWCFWLLLYYFSLFTLLFSPKFPHLIAFANGSKVVFRWIGSICLSPSLKLKFVHFAPICPFNLIFLSQLTKPLHCSMSSDENYFIIEELVMSWLIGIRHECLGLYHWNKCLSCFASLPT